MGISSGNRLVNIVAWIINAVAASGTVAAAYGGMVNPEITSIPAILAMTLPGWLMLAVTVLVVDLFVGRIRRMAVLPVLALVVSAGPMMDYAPLNFNVFSRDDAHGKSEEFTVMSYNVYDLIDMTLDSVGRIERYNAYEPNPTVDQILETGADILALQECPALKTNRQLNITPAQSDSIARRYPFGHCVIGERIYSRYPLTPVELRQPESDWGVFSAAVADIDGRQVLLVSVHMQSIGLNDNDKALFRDLTEGEVEGRRKIKRVKQQLLSKLSSAFKERARQARLLRHEIDSIGIECDCGRRFQRYSRMLCPA